MEDKSLKKGPLPPVDALAREKPTQLMAQLRAFWPHVQAALKAGQTLRLIHEFLKMAGVPFSYKLLVIYRGRIERGKNGRRTSAVQDTTLGARLRAARPRHSKPQPNCARRMKVSQVA